MSQGQERLLQRVRKNDEGWMAGVVRPRREAACRAAGTLCVVGARLPSPDPNKFGDQASQFPSTEEIQKAGSLVAALANRGLEIPVSICCGVVPGQPYVWQPNEQ